MSLITQDGAAVLVCTDGGMSGEKEQIVYCQRIPYTDFPLETISLYDDDGILCLPGER